VGQGEREGNNLREVVDQESIHILFFLLFFLLLLLLFFLGLFLLRMGDFIG
jgi:hypothetical protein